MDGLLPRTHWSEHAISQPWHVGNVLRMFRIVPEHAPQRCHGLVDGVGSDCHIGPDAVEQIIDAHCLAEVLGKAEQQAQRAYLEASALAIARNLARDRIDAPLADAQ